MIFDDKQDIRLTEEQKKIIEEYVNKYPEKWESAAHFIRSAIISFIRQKEKEEQKHENYNNNTKQINDSKATKMVHTSRSLKSHNKNKMG